MFSKLKVTGSILLASSLFLAQASYAIGYVKIKNIGRIKTIQVGLEKYGPAGKHVIGGRAYTKIGPGESTTFQVAEGNWGVKIAHNDKNKITCTPSKFTVKEYNKEMRIECQIWQGYFDPISRTWYYYE